MENNNTCKKCGKTDPKIKHGICFDCFLESIPEPNSDINNSPKPHKSLTTYINDFKNKKFAKHFKKITIIFSVIILLLVSISTIRYFQAPNIAKNAVAIDLSENYDTFLSLQKVYTTVELYGFEYHVEVSGSAKVKINNNSIKTKEEPFSAAVYINCITGKTYTNSIIGNKKIN